MFDVFKDFGRVLGTCILAYLCVFLWCLLLVVPGIVKQYSYAMIPFILHDHPELKNDAAIEKSMEMMEGYKWELFVLHLTFGIGFFFVLPYISLAFAVLYEELKKSRNWMRSNILF